MELAYAFFAHKAQFGADGELSVEGGDFDTIKSSSFPTPPCPFALVAKFRFAPEEFHRKCNLRMVLKGPRGKGLTQDFPFEVPANDSNPEREMGVGIVTHFPGITFKAAGEYRLTLYLDQLELQTLILHLEEDLSDVVHAAEDASALVERGSES